MQQICRYVAFQAEILIVHFNINSGLFQLCADRAGNHLTEICDEQVNVSGNDNMRFWALFRVFVSYI